MAQEHFVRDGQVLLAGIMNCSCAKVAKASPDHLAIAFALAVSRYGASAATAEEIDKHDEKMNWAGRRRKKRRVDDYDKSGEGDWVS